MSSPYRTPLNPPLTQWHQFERLLKRLLGWKGYEIWRAVPKKSDKKWICLVRNAVLYLTFKDCPLRRTNKTRLVHSSKEELPASRIKTQRLSVQLQKVLLRPRSHYTGRIWSCNSHRSIWICVWICVWGKLDQGNHIITVTHAQSLSKSSVFTTFSSARERNIGIFKFLWFEERFRDGLVWTVGLTVEIELGISIER